MSALGGVVRSGVGHRRVQTVVIGLVAMIAVTSAVLGGSLLVASHAPFDRAFAQQHGAHLTAQFDGRRASAAQLAVSAHATGVSAAAGPFGTASVSLTSERGPRLPTLTVAGRADPGGAVDDVTLTAGRWVRARGEIVLADDGHLPVLRLLGTFFTLPDLPGKPALTVVGVARSVSRTAGGWVVPDQVAALRPAGTPARYQMLYRFAAPDSTTQPDAIRATVPAGALTGSVSWLTLRQDAAGTASLFVPILLAFGLLGLVMAVLIVGNVIAGAVTTGTRRIGILKALGFTPDQVVRAYLGQALIPATAGAALGVVAGNLLTLPVLAQTNELYGTVDSGVEPWLDAVMVAGILAVVTLTAWVAALRAGRLRTVDALAVGRTRHGGRGRWAAQLSARSPLPRPVSLGLAHPFARPARSATIIAAIAFGAAAMTFALGLGASLNQIQAAQAEADVVVQPGPQSGPAAGPRSGPDPGPRSGPSGGPPVLADPAAISRAITAQHGTAGYSGVAQTEVTVAGLTGSSDILGFTGNDSARYYRMIAGRWFSGPGEIVVATPFLTATHTRLGDSVVLTDHGQPITVRIVGEAFNTENRGTQLLTAAATLTGAEPALRPTTFNITLQAGAQPAAYAKALRTALSPLGADAIATEHETDSMIVVIDALAGLLTLMLVVVAGLGVLNTVVLQTRERVHDLGVHKALGMTPRQTIAMVIASVLVAGVIGGMVGAPTGVALQRIVIRQMAGDAGFHLPSSVIDVYTTLELAALCLGGLVIAVLGALLPAGWAARTRVATALRTE